MAKKSAARRKQSKGSEKAIIDRLKRNLIIESAADSNSENCHWIHIDSRPSKPYFDHMSYNPMIIHNEYKQLQEMRKRYDAGEITADEYYGYVDEHSILKGRRAYG